MNIHSNLLFSFHFLESRVNAEFRVCIMRKSIKNQIDARVDVLKNELDKRRDKLFNEVDQICKDALKLALFNFI